MRILQGIRWTGFQTLAKRQDFSAYLEICCFLQVFLWKTLTMLYIVLFLRFLIKSSWKTPKPSILHFCGNFQKK